MQRSGSGMSWCWPHGTSTSTSSSNLRLKQASSHAQRLRRRFDRGDLAANHRGVDPIVIDEIDPRQARYHLLNELHPFALNRLVLVGKAGEIALGVSEVSDSRVPLGDGPGADEDNRNDLSFLLQRSNRDVSARENHIGRKPHQLLRIGPKSCRVALAEAQIDSQITTLDPTELAHCLPKSGHW